MLWQNGTSTDDGTGAASALRVIHPPLAEHADLRQPLTVGERQVLELFSRHLPPEWEIYVQPHLNGLRPDFVLLNPNIGIAVFEVKDWNLDAMDYYPKKMPSDRTELWAFDGSKHFPVENKNPFSAASRYKERIFNLYCPRLQQKNGYAAITAGVIFPFASADRVRELQNAFLNETEQEQAAIYWPVAGREDIAAGAIDKIFPEGRRETSGIMRPDLAQDLRGWLVEPDFAAQQRRPLELDARQRQLAESRTTSGFRRIKGAAGSGKSLVLAARAAKLISEGKSVLMVTFNITLWHYLRDLVVRGVRQRGKLDNIELTHFHDWCKNVCIEANLEEAYHELFREVYRVQNSKLPDAEKEKLVAKLLPQLLNVDVPALAAQAAMSPDVTRYDAILVDEGQDYLPLWWSALRNIRKPDGEMLLAADTMQDVYGTARNWTDEAMHGAGFTGDWTRLEVSYRLPRRAQLAARDFATKFLPRDLIDLPEIGQGALDIEHCNLRWVQCEPDQAGKKCVDAILSMMRETGKDGLANADITFICNDIEFGRGVTNELDTYSDGETPIYTVHTFDGDERAGRRRKMGFYMGDGRIKATTLLSFKGWESRLMVVHVSRAKNAEDMASIYAALTRLKRSPQGSWLTVVCSAPELSNYGRGWETVGDGQAHEPSAIVAPATSIPLWNDGPVNSTSSPPNLAASPHEVPVGTPNSADVGLPSFGLRGDDEVPLAILRRVRALLAGSGIEIKDIDHHQYQEAYFFQAKGAIARLNIYYKGNGKVARIHPVKKDDLSDAVGKQLLPLINADLSKDLETVAGGAPTFSRPFLEDHYAEIQFAVAQHGMTVSSVIEAQWHQRYSFARGSDHATVDYFYDGSASFTTCHPVLGMSSSTEFVREVLLATAECPR